MVRRRMAVHLFSKSRRFYGLAVCFSIAILLLPEQCGDDEEGIDRVVAASGELYSTPRSVQRSVDV